MNRRAALQPLLWALLAAAIVRCWLMPLGSSFWVDETATAFVVHYGGGHASFAAAPQVPASIYYALPQAAEKLLGFSEAAYRLPSLLLMGLALGVVSRLAVRLIHPQAAWFTAFACLALHGFNDQAADARPYALGTATAALAVWFLVRWLDAGSWPDALAFGLMAALLWRVHLLLAPFYLVFGIYALVRLARGKSAVGWGRVAAVFAGVVLALAPVAWRAAGLFRQAASHVIVAPPGARDLANSLKYGLLLICGVGAWLARKTRGTAGTPPVAWNTEDAALILSWWLVPPVCLFAISWLTGSSVFVSRYYSVGLAGTALAATLWASRSLTTEMWKPAAAMLGAGALLMAGQWERLWPMHQHSNWRGAAHEVGALAGNSAIPVICPSPFVEARPPVWTPDYPLPGFLYAHLAVYPLHGRLILFPFDDSPEAEAYAARLSQSTLAAAGKFVIYGGAGQAGFWWKWLAGRPELAGWTSKRVGDFGDVTVVLFTR
jgi:Dolichyl-phosphate-mannose-protein mannosyltransferase